ncbi:MAG TPA: phosphate acyltransferase PlsX, partial [Actinobacteria bacterium]|nr:phosphate acyltransferase PlsX [Actinomycetes bacterium]HEX21760.1 phosphate acyltransferase PlsX [Actinomycetota bacterium]
MTVAIDAMGGDHAPQQNIHGAMQALRKAKDNLRIILVGNVDKIRPHINDQPKNILLKHTSDVIRMNEHPVRSVKKKTDSSLVVAATMVKEGEADAFVSAGNTGAVTAAGLLIIKRIKGIDRPASATMFPTRRGFSLILDAGANADCRAENLVEFAKMGSIYLHHMSGKNKPSVGLLNIGEESSKGNMLYLRAHELLRKTDLNFYGNVEGRDLPLGTSDIVVCDGFTGNIALKLMEGVSDSVFKEIKKEISKSFRGRLGATFLLSSLKKLRKRLNPENYGGSPLLGIDGVGVIAHGSSSPTAIANAVLAAAMAVE